jgi:hypothetical protein
MITRFHQPQNDVFLTANPKGGAYSTPLPSSFNFDSEFLKHNQEA